LNDRTGTLGAWQQHTNRYLVYVDSECYALKVCNLYCVPESWVAEVRGRPFRKQIDVMASKFNAPGNWPCPRSVLQVLPKHYGGPGTTRQQVQSWWGPHVFRYIRQQMDPQSQKKGWMNWAMFDAMQRGEIYMAGVRSDGSHEMQERPQPITDDTFMVWPTIVFLLPGSTMFGSYCQGLALAEGSSAWVAHRDSLEIYGKFGQIDIERFRFVDVQTSTVVIEEIIEEEVSGFLDVQTSTVVLEEHGFVDVQTSTVVSEKILTEQVLEKQLTEEQEKQLEEYGFVDVGEDRAKRGRRWGR
jgi:hypothetical protein